MDSEGLRWQGLNFSVQDESTYIVQCSVVVSDENIDPREIPHCDLKSALGVSPNDQVEITWGCPIEIAERSIQQGDVFEFEAVVHVVDAKGGQVKRFLESISDQLEKLTQIMAFYWRIRGEKEETPLEEHVFWATIEGQVLSAWVITRSAFDLIKAREEEK